MNMQSLQVHLFPALRTVQLIFGLIELGLNAYGQYQSLRNCKPTLPHTLANQVISCARL